MKDLKDIIQEKLKVGSKTKIHTRNPEDWSIIDAEDGDIVKWNDSGLYFIYKCLDTDNKTIIYHIACILDDRKILYEGPDKGVGDITKPNLFKLASEKEKEKFFEFLKEKGYKWDDTKLEVVKK